MLGLAQVTRQSISLRAANFRDTRRQPKSAVCWRNKFETQALGPVSPRKGTVMLIVALFSAFRFGIAGLRIRYCGGKWLEILAIDSRGS
jgi:hypothetical protein